MYTLWWVIWDIYKIKSVIKKATREKRKISTKAR